ncbi:hypothetical protein BT93_L1740 [Corymbia citriodora subsp. variegata]|uniref:Amidase n=1 Tax=Corymbia citriodora subsp. variegata TaxID=360336 RepID=A0A8T0CLW1_CORYI|nr:hypothetical protein BT93_L1740 [Corymbia citriodora subsp. variegata]
MVTLGARADTVLAFEGYPALTVPAGYDDNGMPFGICFGGLKGSEAKLIEIAYSFEQATRIHADKWGKRKEDEGSFGSSRPKLNLQPRTMVVCDGAGSGSGAVAKPKASSPFGEARPREEVLKEKGLDWKEIDEKLDTMKIKEVDTGDKAEGSFGRRSFGSGNGGQD